jgi:dolichyl-phosphate-mannose--protein O-mannosyl transferase
MRAAGDNPFGWRVAAAVCGALTLPAVFLWAYLLLDNAGLAYVAATLAFLNNFTFVMSRIAMMDAFLMFFLMWSFVAFTAALATDMSAGSRRALFGLSGLLVGSAGACKWNAIDTLAVFVLVTACLWVAPRLSPKWSSPLVKYAQNVREIGVPMAILGLLVLPITAYTLSYWPLCQLIKRPFNLQELAAIHGAMWKFNSTAISNRAITSPWYAWPVKVSPQRALSYLMGNPVVTWGGVAAMGYCARQLWKSARFAEGLVLLLYLSNYLQWAVTPEKGLFYYYYYPSVMVLGVAIAMALRALPAQLFGVRLSLLAVLAAMLVFVWCYPQMAHLQAPWDCMFGCWS